MNYATFRQTHPLPWCWACGRTEYQPPRDWFAPWLIERAHIVGGIGCRVEDVRAVVLLCSRCHRLAHGATFRIQGRRLPNLKRAHLLWLKRHRDSERYDRAFLRGCAIGALERAAKPPQWFLLGYESRRGYPGACSGCHYC